MKSPSARLKLVSPVYKYFVNTTPEFVFKSVCLDHLSKLEKATNLSCGCSVQHIARKSRAQERKSPHFLGAIARKWSEKVPIFWELLQESCLILSKQTTANGKK